MTEKEKQNKRFELLARAERTRNLNAVMGQFNQALNDLEFQKTNLIKAVESAKKYVPQEDIDLLIGDALK